jgi:hypothetical protein
MGPPGSALGCSPHGSSSPAPAFGRDAGGIAGLAERYSSRSPGPDTAAAGRHLQSFTAGLKEAGALAAAGAAVVESIARVAHWLGPVAAGVLALL